MFLMKSQSDAIAAAVHFKSFGWDGLIFIRAVSPCILLQYFNSCNHINHNDFFSFCSSWFFRAGCFQSAGPEPCRRLSK